MFSSSSTSSDGGEYISLHITCASEVAAVECLEFSTDSSLFGSLFLYNIFSNPPTQLPTHLTHTHLNAWREYVRQKVRREESVARVREQGEQAVAHQHPRHRLHRNLDDSTVVLRGGGRNQAIKQSNERSGHTEHIQVVTLVVGNQPSRQSGDIERLLGGEAIRESRDIYQEFE